MNEAETIGAVFEESRFDETCFFAWLRFAGTISRRIGRTFIGPDAARNQQAKQYEASQTSLVSRNMH
jgi:hypothetical protein